MANAVPAGHRIEGRDGGGTSATVDQFPKHHIADLSNLHPSVPQPVRFALGVVSSYVASLLRAGRDPKTAASRISSLVADINSLVR